MEKRECFKNDFTNEDLIVALLASDLLITDYSSIIFEYSLLNRPMVFYAPDLDEFKGERGFYFGYEDFVPGKICKTEAELVRVINEQDFEMEKVEKFNERFGYGFDGKATLRAVERIVKNI
jgi:CDP-ribitol ribitolphosphotransferase